MISHMKVHTAKLLLNYIKLSNIIIYKFMHCFFSSFVFQNLVELMGPCSLPWAVLEAMLTQLNLVI